MEYTDVCAVITRGAEGFTVVRRDASVKEHAVVASEKVKKTAGAGDTFTGAICSIFLRGGDFSSALEAAKVASRMTVESEGKTSVISDELTWASLE